MSGLFLGIGWNALLAMIPLVAAVLLDRISRRFDSASPRPSRLWMLPLGIVWLAFLPNTCYLMTEWRHFLFDERFVAARQSVDPNSIAVIRVVIHAACFLLYSGFGVVCFVMAIRPVSDMLARWGMRPYRLAVPFFLATSLGVYLGLIVRLNTWDLATRPGYVCKVALGAILNPRLMTIVIAYAIVLWLTYLATDVWLAGLSYRLRRPGNLKVGLNAEKYRIVPR